MEQSFEGGKSWEMLFDRIQKLILHFGLGLFLEWCMKIISVARLEHQVYTKLQFGQSRILLQAI